MPGFAVDTSCMVAAVCVWHEHHERAAGELTRRLSARQAMVVAAPTLVESYAVLTRLPPPHRLAPPDAVRLIAANFADTGRVVALDARAYFTLIRKAPDQGVAGGRIYDAVIAQCAIKGGASCLLTFNAYDFASFTEGDLEIVVP